MLYIVAVFLVVYLSVIMIIIIIQYEDCNIVSVRYLDCWVFTLLGTWIVVTIVPCVRMDSR